MYLYVETGEECFFQLECKKIGCGFKMRCERISYNICLS